MKYLKILCLFAIFTLSSVVRADEGMWMIHKIDSTLMQKMRAAGLKLPANVIYDEEALSISDAVVALDFGCTGSIISDQGLLITNHHCAYSDIYSISTPEKDYLEDGFWAMRMEEEIPIKDKNVFFLRKVIDVTEEYNALKENEARHRRGITSRKLTYILEKKYSEETGLEASLASMWRGTQYYMYLYEVYSDVRLVGAPPVSIGSFGGDIDNWEWPQHKGDFALYRIYTAPDGSPAKYSPDNLPLKPRKVLSISKQGIKTGDFTMVIGFPGRTERYCSSYAAERKMNIDDPVMVGLQREKMNIMRCWMNKNPLYRMTYSEQFFSISNVQELFEGEMNTLCKYKVCDIKAKEEKELREWIASDGERVRKWGDLFENLSRIYAKTDKLQKQKNYHRESIVKSSKYYMLAIRIINILSAAEKKNIDSVDLRHDNICSFAVRSINELFKEMQPEVERDLLKYSAKEFIKNVDKCYWGEFIESLNLSDGSRMETIIDSVIDNSFLKDSVAFEQFASEIHSVKELACDPLVKFYNSSHIKYINNDISNICMRELCGHGKNTGKGRGKGKGGGFGIINSLEKDYTTALYQMRKEKGIIQYPDANSTMRITYGTVGPLESSDTIKCCEMSSAYGILEKYNPDQYEYTLKADYLELLKKDASVRDMTVNFLSNNDITGGNSGSPVLNANGEIVGLAFDGNKESLCGNLYFHPDMCKCVSVDIRYVIWILEKYAHFDRILEETGIK